jgi:lipoprotein-anchoring transpeptidase ErfK/SrfK
MVKHAGTLFVLLAACTAAGMLAASVLADSTPPPAAPVETTTTTAPAPTVPAGVVLGGVAIGGLTADAATQAVLTRFAQPVLVRVGGRTIRLAPSTMGVAVPADAAVAKALTVAPGTSLGLHASVNVPDVRAFVAALAARFDHKPVAARLLLHDLKPLVTTSKPGLVIDRAAAVLAVRKALANAIHTPVNLPARQPKPSVTSQAVGPVIVIRRGSNLLTLYDGMKVVRQFHVATGQAIYPTPLGRFQIIVKWKNPWWYPPDDPWAKGEKPTPPGPDNPLGTRWMGISSPGVGIHGTPESGSIGYSLSHGCIRMLIPQAEWLFDRVNVGTPVFIVPA